MLELNHSLLNGGNILMNVLKALATIVSMCSLHVIFQSKITPRYFKPFKNGMLARTAFSQNIALLTFCGKDRCRLQG
jgi:hypothetical protein